MIQGVEYHGRLCRRDGRPANPGTYTLKFALHADLRTRRSGWNEEIEGVVVAPGGFYSVLLGLSTPLKAQHFRDTPRWLSVRVVRRGEVGDETSPRAPLNGASLILASALEATNQRLEKVEAQLSALLGAPSPNSLSARIDAQQATLERVERQVAGPIAQQMGAIDQRLAALDSDDGRLDQIEDRLDDIDGTDGDIVDTIERLEAVERLITDAGPREVEAMARRLERLQLAIERLAAQG